jgi:acyl dehydratase
MSGKISGRDRSFYLEDVSVGQRFSTGSLELDETQIKTFAAQFDPHLDAEIAKATLFGGLVASGWHTAAITMRLLVTSGIPLAWGMIGTECSVKWPNPARPGDTLTVHGEVTQVKPSRSRPDRGTINIIAETRNQRDDVLQILTATLLVPRRYAEDQSGRLRSDIDAKSRKRQ